MKFDFPKSKSEVKPTPDYDGGRNEFQDQRILTFAEVKKLDQDNIVKALKKTSGKVFGEGGAAQILEVPPTTLLSRMKKLDI